MLESGLWRPFRALHVAHRADPGLCPRLSCYSPLGLMVLVPVLTLASLPGAGLADDKPLPPNEAATRFVIHEDLELDQVLTEPAVRQPVFLNFDERGFWKSPERLRAELAEHGSPEQVVHYCGSGVSAAVNLLAYKIAGHSDTKLYPGGWSEWCAGSSRAPSATPQQP